MTKALKLLVADGYEIDEGVLACPVRAIHWQHDLLTLVRLPLLRLRRRGFLMTVIELPDEQAALKAKAAADGLTLEAWL